MRCRSAQKRISDYVDGGLDARTAERLERHLATCAACRELVRDFRGMAEAASRLPVAEPGKDVWTKIKARVSALETSPASLPGAAPIRRPALGWSAATWKFAGVAAAALLLVAAGIFLGVRTERKGAPASLADRERYTLAKLDEAERYYQQAINSLSEAFAAEKGSMIPQVAEMFEKNLSVVDATIQACRRAVIAEPEDLQARNYLLTAYMNKMSVLDAALENRSPNGTSLTSTKKSF